MNSINKKAKSGLVGVRNVKFELYYGAFLGEYDETKFMEMCGTWTRPVCIHQGNSVRTVIWRLIPRSMIKGARSHRLNQETRKPIVDAVKSRRYSRACWLRVTYLLITIKIKLV